MKELNFVPKVDENFRPIYEDGHILVGRLAEIAVPGLYAIEPITHKESVRELSDTEVVLFAYMQRLIRVGLKTTFNIAVCGLYFEEHLGRQVASYTIPFHIDMLRERFSVDVYQPHIAEYLRSYAFPSSSLQVSLFDSGMVRIVNTTRVRSDLENIKNGISLAKKINVPVVSMAENKYPIEGVLEIFDESELPKAPEGKKYFVCLGGSKNFQCFLCDSRLSKGEFIFSHEDDVDDCLKPVYVDDQIIVRQDAKYAIPGFYIVSPKFHYRSIDEMPQDLYEKCMFMARDIKQGLMTLGLNQSHIYHDEKYNSPASVHFWVLPLFERYLNEHDLSPTIFSKDIWDYLDKFPKFSDTKSQISEFNEKMKNFLMCKHEGV
jgi:diadenosine tetraphosphate (Ap4A) HIT family hydrolase